MHIIQTLEHKDDDKKNKISEIIYLVLYISHRERQWRTDLQIHIVTILTTNNINKFPVNDFTKNTREIVTTVLQWKHDYFNQKVMILCSISRHSLVISSHNSEKHGQQRFHPWSILILVSKMAEILKLNYESSKNVVTILKKTPQHIDK